MIFKDLLGNGSLGQGIKVGMFLEETTNKNIQLWQEQEGNTPAIYKWEQDDFQAEINTLDKLIIGFHVDFMKFENLTMVISNKSHSFNINAKSSFEAFIKFLNSCSIKWAFLTQECIDQKIVIKLESNILFYFLFDSEDWGLFRLGIFDLELYNSKL